MSRILDMLGVLNCVSVFKAMQVASSAIGNARQRSKEPFILLLSCSLVSDKQLSSFLAGKPAGY